MSSERGPAPGRVESFADCLSRRGAAGDRWLLLGKGPSFSVERCNAADGYRRLGLNHVVRQVRVDVAHATDLDVLESLDATALDNAALWVMPWHPHVRNRPGEATLESLAREHPVLRRLAGEGRICWYNSSRAADAAPGQPVVPVRFFSADAAVHLLAVHGVRHIRTLGIDGGTSYSPTFGDLDATTLLANGRSSFDRQFEAIAEAVFRHDLDFGPLDDEVPVRVYVATEPAQMLATRVLEYSIRRRASITSRVYPICDFDIPVPEPRSLENRPRTPFSFQRFLIPEAAGLRGRAIYLDSDMQVFTDIRALWRQPMHGAPLLSVAPLGSDGRRPQFSVMLLDCERLGWRIADIVRRLDDGELDYAGLMYEMKVAPGWRADIDPAWNCLERYDSGTRLLHYTDMQVQPWVSRANPLAYLWVAELRSAVASGHVERGLVDEHVARGYLRPSLAWQLDHDVDDPLLLPRAARALDDDYVPPYMSLQTRGLGSPWVSAPVRARAFARHLYRTVGLADAVRRLRNVVFK